MKLIQLLKLASGLSALCVIGIVISCNSMRPLVDPFDIVEQNEIDIDLIETYLADQGYSDYDTLATGVRVVIIEQGEGESIEYNDNIQYDYIGKFTDGTLFDASIARLTYDQDLLNIVDSIHITDIQGPVLDANGLQELDSIEYNEGYEPIYSPIRLYQPFITTHSIDGWFINSTRGFVLGFAPGVHHVLDNTGIGGRGLILIPSVLGYGRFGNPAIGSNKVLLFEIRPVAIK